MNRNIGFQVTLDSEIKSQLKIAGATETVSNLFMIRWRKFQMIGKIVSHYKILEKLGEGGMGVVYKAEDAKLKRTVALKFLPTELTKNPKARKRFIQEAQAASALDHPNICVIHEIDEAEDGQMFICMAYYEGETLEQKIENGPLDTEEIINIALQIAQGLGKAHENGIVHRDIKPGNIIITNDGTAKILDFGLAKLADQVRITKTGATIGTVAYMSPEQARGEEVDHQSDIWSLGVVLYEMITGQLPFRGEYNQAVIYSILNEEPEPMVPRDSGQAGVPTELEDIVSKALTKNKADRYQQVEDMLIDLQCFKRDTSKSTDSRKFRRSVKRLLSPSKKRKLIIPIVVLIGILVIILAIYLSLPQKVTGPIQKRILVSTFENRTGDPVHDPIGLMATDWLKQGLIETGLVTVVSIPETDLSAEARKNIDMLISGAYYQAGKEIQFHAQITDFQNGEILRVIDPVSGSATDPVLSISALRQKILGALASIFDPWLKIHVDTGSRPPTYEAYQEYIKAYDYDFDHRKANEHYYKAAALDSTFTQALLSAAFRHIVLREFSRADSIVKIVRNSQKRLPAIDRYWLDFLEASLSGNSSGILRAFRQMAQLNSDFQIYCAGYALDCNRPQEALDILLALDPEGEMATSLSYYYWSRITMAYHLLGDHEQELKEARHGKKLFANSEDMLYFEARALAALGRIQELKERLNERLNMGVVGRFTPSDFMRGITRALYRHGYKKAAKEVIEIAIRWYKNNPSKVNDYQYAMTLYLADRLEESKELFENLVAQKPDNASYLGQLGQVYATKGNREKAMQISQLLEKLEQPYRFGDCTCWRAGIAALLGEKERAMILLRQALDQGLGYWRLHPYRSLEPLWDYPPFQELIRPKG